MTLAGLRGRSRRLAANSRALPAVLRAVIRGSARTVWIGDSHAATLIPAPGGRSRYCFDDRRAALRLWVGPRLAFSVARDGVPLNRIEVHTVRRLRPSAVVFVLGEIDVRTRLGRQRCRTDEGLAWVTEYVATCERFGRAVGAPRVLFVEVPPPSDVGAENPEYPRHGSLGQRVDAHRRFHEAIDRAVTFGRVVPTADLVCGSDGSLREGATDDGVHLSAASARRVVARVLDAVT